MVEKSETAASAAVSRTNPFNTFRVINRIHCHPQLNIVRCFKGTNRIAVNDPLGYVVWDNDIVLIYYHIPCLIFIYQVDQQETRIRVG